MASLRFLNEGLTFTRIPPYVVLAGLLFAPTSASADPKTDIIGGPGGGAFDDRCPEGSYLVGVDTTSGKDLNVITAICQGAARGHLIGPTVKLHSYGKFDNGGVFVRFAAGGPIMCPPDTAVEGIQVQVSKVALVHAVALRCRNMTGHDYQTTSFSNSGAGEAAYERLADCNGTSLASGLIGRYGALVDALGLSCEVIVPPPQLPIRQTGRPTASNANMPIKTTGRIASPPGAAGSRAKVDTTVYDRPAGNAIAYLKSGDPVTITSCDQNQWCFITLPRAGAVWGPDLQR